MSDKMKDRATSQTQGRITRQIDPGLYRVGARGKSGEPDVGMVFAEGTPGQTVIEHWVLSEGHASPNRDQNMVVAPTDESFNSLHDFFEAMRARSREWQEVTYIKATCEYHDGIPQL